MNKDGTLEEFIEDGYVISAKIKKALGKRKPLVMAKMAAKHALEIFPNDPFKAWAEAWLAGKKVDIYQCDTIAVRTNAGPEDYDLIAQLGAHSAGMAIMWAKLKSTKLTKQWAYDSIEKSALAYLVKQKANN